MRLKKERWLVEEQMRHSQEKHKMRMKAEQKGLLEERRKKMNKQNQLLSEEQEQLSGEDMEVPQAIEKGLSRDSSNVPPISAEDETYGGKETPVDVIKDKGKEDINPVILSKEQVDLGDDEIEEEKSKLPNRKLKVLSRMTVAKLQQKDKKGREKLAWKLPDFIKRIGVVKVRQLLQERESKDNESEDEEMNLT
ncbi:hypothetical protein TNIN_287071 [Trichonephila inaurata madagascariensis]|uniref:Uncharacterized protein n=1 Tax=Trichonephila inaurata madagascariensis TaxID=2747483 RepID=A0A8X6MJY4_9ARAC|nr:hypothetical protein TNIN_287071 [Trichonephila inaurata madagascariensis]